MLERSADGIALLDPEGFTLYTNPAALRLLGLSAPEPGVFADRLHPEDRSALIAAMAAAGRDPGGKPVLAQFRVGRRRPDARRLDEDIADPAPVPARRIEAHIRAMSDGQAQAWLMVNLREAREPGVRAPNPIGALPEGNTAPDASMAGRAGGEDVRAKGHMLDLLLRNLPVTACLMDAAGNLVASHGQGGLTREDEGAARWPDGLAKVQRAASGETVHFQFESGTGERKRVREIWLSPNPEDGGVICLGVDVTDRKRAEEELSKSEALGRRIIESSRDCIMVLDSAGSVLSISHNGRKLLEIEAPEEYTGRSWLEFWRGGDRSQAEEAMREAGRTGLGKFQGYCPTAQGKPKWWDVVLTPILDTAFEPERLVAVFRDISEQKRFEETLRRSKDQMEAVLRTVTDALVVGDAGGRVVYATDAAARLFGRANAQELLGSQLDDLAAGLPVEDERGEPAAWPVPRAGSQCEGGQVLHLRDFADTGSGERDRWLVANTATVRDGEGRVQLTIASAYDFTERKRAESALKQSELQLRQSQKMEAVGRLAGGVAHDFNNLLTAINGYSELLSKSLDDRNPLQETIHEIRRAGERAASLTRQLLTFSRRQAPANRILDLNETVNDIRQMLGRLIGEDIHLVTVLEASLARIQADPGQMEQLLLNLALNARDAMPTGGSLTIRTANARMEAGEEGALFPAVAGRYVKLTVADTGIGMDDEVKAHLFEPFFTTKPAGQGTGLGLSTVYGIVKAAGGNLSLESEKGHGAMFSIWLPALDAGRLGDDAGLEAPAMGSHETGSGRETILLVEDEDMVRRLIGQVLVTHGYNVVEAGSGHEALEAVARHPGQIDLLLTDVVMAGMSGRELSEKLVDMRPGLKVLFMSGYTDDAVLRHGVFHKSAAFLGKPFSPGILVRKLREVIAGDVAAVAARAPLN